MTMIIHEIFSRITHEYAKCRIYLLGSYAYGIPVPGSDLDIAVILSKVESASERIFITFLQRKVSSTCGTVVIKPLFHYVHQRCGIALRAFPIMSVAML